MVTENLVGLSVTFSSRRLQIQSKRFLPTGKFSSKPPFQQFCLMTTGPHWKLTFASLRETNSCTKGAFESTQVSCGVLAKCFGTLYATINVFNTVQPLGDLCLCMLPSRRWTQSGCACLRTCTNRETCLRGATRSSTFKCLKYQQTMPIC